MTISSETAPYATKPGLPSSRLSRGYLIGWGLLAGCALVYLALIAARPDLAGAMLGRSNEIETGRGQQAAALGTPEIGAIRQMLGEIQTQVDALRNEAALRDGREQALTVRVAALETPTTKSADIVDATPVAQRVTEGSAPSEKPGLLSGASIQGKVEERKLEERPAKPAPRAAVAAAQPPATWTTAQPRAAPASPSAVRIASGPSLDALRLSWSLLLEGNRPILKPLEARWVEMTGEAGSFALLAGPLGSPEDATKICASLKAKRVPCSVTRFGGQPL